MLVLTFSLRVGRLTNGEKVLSFHFSLFSPFGVRVCEERRAHADYAPFVVVSLFFM